MAELDPLTVEQRAQELARARPRRGLPIAPDAKPGARRLPLAEAAREIDRQHRPIYTVWEITLACDLACRHCGSRAGKHRPDELTTAEALDLVDQIADLGCKEVTLIGGEAYLREDWLDIVRRIKARGMICTTTSGGRGAPQDRAPPAASPAGSSHLVAARRGEGGGVRLRARRRGRRLVDGTLHRMKAGDLAAFPAGSGICHTFLNNGDRDATLLVGGGEANKSDNRIYYALHPRRRDDMPWSHWWDDIPLRPQGPHDGKPDALGAKEKASK